MKALASDFDGTLYFGEKESIKQTDITAIDIFQEAGNLFGVCTGRPLIGVHGPNHNLINYDFYIVSSGAAILDKELNVIYEKCLDRNIIEMLYQRYKNQARISIQANHKIYSFIEDTYMPIENEKISSIEDINGNQFFGVSIDATTEEQAKYICERIQIEFSGDVEAHQNTHYVDVVSKGCSKGKAIHILKNQYSPRVVYGIGDSYNDIPLLDSVDKAFTFYSSPEIVKEHADYLTNSVEEAIEKVLEI